MKCALPPEGWECSREAGHEGPCAARPLTSEQDPRLGEGFAFFAWHCALKDGYQDLSCDGYRRGRICAMLWDDLQMNSEECRWEEIDPGVYLTCRPECRYVPESGMELPEFCNHCGKPVVGVDPHE